MTKKNKIDEQVEAIFTTFGETGKTGEVDKMVEELPDVIMSAEEENEVETCSIPSLQNALNLCEHFLKDRDRWDETLEHIKDNIHQEKHVETWMRGLMGVRTTEQYKKEVLDDLRLSVINKYVFQAAEKESNIDPGRQTLKWYVAILDRGVEGQIQKKIFQRLAFHYMRSSKQDEHIAKAKAYLSSLEHRGILPDNPYGGFWGQYNHSELIESIMNDTYEDNLMRIRTEYGIELMEYLKDKGLTDENQLEWFDLFEVLDICYGKVEDNRIFGSKHMKRDLEYWDDFLKRYCEMIKSNIEQKSNDEAFVRAAQDMIRSLQKGDSWLLKYVELEAGANRARYEQLIGEWIDLLSGLTLGEGCLTLDALYNEAIRIRQEEGDEEAVTRLLERRVHTCDLQSTLMRIGTHSTNGLRNRVWCTDNAMALTYRYHEAGNEDMKAQMIADIRSTDSECDMINVIDRMLSDKPVHLMEKYIVLLETIGEPEEAAEWRQKLFSMTETGPDECRMLYQQGKIDEALELCKQQMESDGKNPYIDYESRLKLLEYLTGGSEPSDATDARNNFARISGNEWGFFITCIGREDWKKFFADIDDMASLYSRGCDDNSNKEIYSPEEYMLHYSFEPNTVYGAGSYFKYLYGTGAQELERFFTGGNK